LTCGKKVREGGGGRMNTTVILNLKVSTNEKKGGLKVVAFDTIGLPLRYSH
jgi:hypothetical protein